MKFLLLLLLITSNAFAAFDICTHQETSDMMEALEVSGTKVLKTSKNHKRYTFVEKQMIHLAVAQQSYLAGVSKEEALNTFADIGYDGKPGFNAGEIEYFNIDLREIAVVHYWPGDNEYGAIFSIKKGAPKLIATIEDSFITCK